MKAGAETPATDVRGDGEHRGRVRSMKAGAETPATGERCRVGMAVDGAQ